MVVNSYEEYENRAVEFGLSMKWRWVKIFTPAEAPASDLSSVVPELPTPPPSLPPPSISISPQNYDISLDNSNIQHPSQQNCIIKHSHQPYSAFKVSNLINYDNNNSNNSSNHLDIMKDLTATNNNKDDKISNISTPPQFISPPSSNPVTPKSNHLYSQNHNISKNEFSPLYPPLIVSAPPPSSDTAIVGDHSSIVTSCPTHMFTPTGRLIKLRQRLLLNRDNIPIFDTQKWVRSLETCLELAVLRWRTSWEALQQRNIKELKLLDTS